jgi:nucleotide-binding universal stress UspA family protein
MLRDGRGHVYLTDKLTKPNKVACFFSERIHMKLLVGYDGSNAALAATELAKRHAKAFQAEKVYLVRSMEGGQDVERREFDNAEHDLGRVNRTFSTEDIPSEPHLLVRGLSPGEDLVQFAKENGIDEIIIGVRRRSKVGKLVFGSTAQYVILNAPCPVVSVK